MEAVERKDARAGAGRQKSSVLGDSAIGKIPAA
jgi:hypothetical protein